MKKYLRSPQLMPLAALLLLFLFNFVANRTFFDIVFRDGQYFGSLIDIGLRAAPLILTAMGMTLVIATGGVDLSVGAMAALAPAVAVTILDGHGSFLLGLSAGLIAAGVVGIWNGLLISVLGLQPIVATLTAMVAGRGVAQLVLSGQIAPFTETHFRFLGQGYLFGLPFALTLVTLVFVTFASLIRFTALGLYFEALGDNGEAARAVGLNANAVKIMAYVGAAGFAALSGLLVSSNIQAVDVNNLGQYLELDAILAVVIGGTSLQGGRFSLLGSVLGALIIQTVVTTINTQGIAVESMLIVKALVVILICLFQSERLRVRLAKISNKTLKNMFKKSVSKSESKAVREGVA